MKLKEVLLTPPLAWARLPRVVALAGLALAGCTTSPKMQERVTHDNKSGADVVAKAVGGPGLAGNVGPNVAGGNADADRRAAEQASQVVLRRAAKPWVASVSVPMGSGEKLPSVFQETVRFNFNDKTSGGKVGLRLVAERITTATGVPVRIKPDVFNTGAGQSAPAAPMPVSLPLPSMPQAAPGGSTMPVVGAGGSAAMPSASSFRETSVEAVAMRWNGSLEGYLNHITDLTNLSWEYRDGVVVIERFRTEFFEIAMLEGETTYSMGLNASDQGNTGAGSAGGGATSNNNASVDVTEKGKASSLASVLNTIQAIIKDVQGSSAVRSEGSGRIAVTTTKETMAKVRDFVRAENDALLRQAQIQFDIYSVRSNEGDERSVDWSLMLRSLSDALAFRLNSPNSVVGPNTGNLGFSVLTPKETGSSRAVRFADSKAILQLLSEQGAATQHRPVSLLTLNRQWARKASLGSKAYVSETTPGSISALTGAAGQSGLKTSTLTTGDRYLAQPYIMDNNTVVLKFGIGLSSLVALPSFGPEGQEVQIPEITNIVDQSTIALKTGQVLVITGLSRIVTSDDKRTLSENASVMAGGSKKLLRQREDFIIFVRPTIL